MKSRLIQIALILLLATGPGLAAAAPADGPDAATIHAADSAERLAWQRVGAPDSLPG